MSAEAVAAQPCYILRQKPYRESSLILDVISQDFGRLALLAKGVRKPKSKTAGLLQAFNPLLVSYLGHSELRILADVYTVRPSFMLEGLALYCGFYVNELLLRFTSPDDPCSELFLLYETCLGNMVGASSLVLQASLRNFELQLLAQMGYGLQLSYEVNTGLPVMSNLRYNFIIDAGPTQHQQGLYLGQTLLALATGRYDGQTLAEAKRLMRTAIDYYLPGKPLRSRQVINQVMKTLE